MKNDKDFIVSDAQYFLVEYNKGEINFSNKSVSQIGYLLDFQNETEKENTLKFLNNSASLSLSKTKINTIYQIIEDEQRKNYIMNFDDKIITVFAGTQLKIEIQKNDIWETYLSDRFGQYKDYAKKWLSAYCFAPKYFFENNLENMRLPIMILVGARRCGKTTFIRLVSKIFGDNHYAKISKENFQSKFDSFKKNRLVHVNESSKLDCSQYEKLKGLMGSDLVSIEFKGKDIVTQQNNIAMMIDSNKKNPIYTMMDEEPTNESDNQFFVCEFNTIEKKSNKHIKLLEQSFLNYIQTELKTVFENEVIPNIDRHSWIISTPITEHEKIMFRLNKTNSDYLQENVCNILFEEYIKNNKTFIATTSLQEICENLKQKSMNYFKSDLSEIGIIDPTSVVVRISTKTVRGYTLNAKVIEEIYRKFNVKEKEETNILSFVV
jgi:hypothetical protein